MMSKPCGGSKAIDLLAIKAAIDTMTEDNLIVTSVVIKDL